MKQAVDLMKQGRFEEAIPFWLTYTKSAACVYNNEIMASALVNLSICYSAADLHHKAMVTQSVVFNMSLIHPISDITLAYLNYAQALNCIYLLEYGMAKRFLDKCRKYGPDENLSKSIGECLVKMEDLSYHNYIDYLEALYNK